MAYQKAARVGDQISHGGQVTTGSSKCFHGSTNRAFARVGDQVICTIHNVQTIVTGSSIGYWDGIKAARVTSLCSCGATIITGADNVLIND